MFTKVLKYYPCIRNAKILKTDILKLRSHL